MDIRFDPVKHTYTNVFTGEFYTSVTRFINTFKKKFNADEVAKGVALREGRSVQDVLDEWKKINDDSKVYGTKIHGILEEYSKTGKFEDENADLIKAYKKMGTFKQKDGAMIEALLHNHFYKIAGTADIILPTGEYFDVFDIKTNKKFNFYSKYGDYFLAPLEYLPYSEYNLYTLQTSLYAYLYEGMTGRKFRQSGVFYFDREKVEFHYYPTIYLKNEIIKLLDFSKQNG